MQVFPYPMRSWLVVPAIERDNLRAAMASVADIVVLDMSRNVTGSGLATARTDIRNILSRPRPSDGDGNGKNRLRFFVQINQLDGPHSQSDLDAVMPGAPDGIMLPGARGGRDIERLASRLSVCEAVHGLDDGQTAIAARAPATAEVMFAMDTFAGASPRLCALAWDAPALMADIGASQARDQSGQWTAPMTSARSACLFAAHAANVRPINTSFADRADQPGLTLEVNAAARDGFCGMMSVDPAQVPIINTTFSSDV